LIEQSDRITQQRERLWIFDDFHSMKILLYLRFQFSLRVLIFQKNRDDDNDDVHLSYYLFIYIFVYLCLFMLF
jgi:hypothetical protein